MVREIISNAQYRTGSFYFYFARLNVVAFVECPKYFFFPRVNDIVDIKTGNCSVNVYNIRLRGRRR